MNYWMKKHDYKNFATVLNNKLSIFLEQNSESNYKTYELLNMIEDLLRDFKIKVNVNSNMLEYDLPKQFIDSFKTKMKKSCYNQETLLRFLYNYILYNSGERTIFKNSIRGQQVILDSNYKEII